MSNSSWTEKKGFFLGLFMHLDLGPLWRPPLYNKHCAVCLDSQIFKSKNSWYHDTVETIKFYFQGYLGGKDLGRELLGGRKSRCWLFYNLVISRSFVCIDWIPPQIIPFLRIFPFVFRDILSNIKKWSVHEKTVFPPILTVIDFRVFPLRDSFSSFFERENVK